MSQFQILGRRPFPFKAVSTCFVYANFPGTIEKIGYLNRNSVRARKYADI